jgi:hypothetical protein
MNGPSALVAHGMYGDLQGIAGSTLRELEAFELPLIESKNSGT